MSSKLKPALILMLLASVSAASPADAHEPRGHAYGHEKQHRQKDNYHHHDRQWNQPRVGQRLVMVQPVPRHIMMHLRPAPRGYFYSMHRQNIFVVSQRDHTIAQIIQMFLQ